MSRSLATVSPASGSVSAGAMLNMDYLITELDYHRKKAQRLAVLNELHGRLARATDLPGMIEALSVWMMPEIDHELIAYNNPIRNRQYFYCSCHGPKRRQVMDMARQVFDGTGKSGHVSFDDQPYHVQQWCLAGNKRRGDSIVLLREKRMERDEMGLMGDVLQALREPLQRALEYEDLFEMANNDALTGLANRRVFEGRIDSMLDSARRHKRPMSLASMDLDFFKQVNDTFGHDEGDRVLQKVAAIMKKTVRSSDLLVRMGGDEFLLTLPDTSLQAALTLAERLCREVDKLGITVPGDKKLGISIGLVAFRPGMSRKDLLLKADEVLYEAKSNGRARVCVAS